MKNKLEVGLIIFMLILLGSITIIELTKPNGNLDIQKIVSITQISKENYYNTKEETSIMWYMCKIIYTDLKNQEQTIRRLTRTPCNQLNKEGIK